MSTKNAPGAYDCYKNAEPDEPMFILLGRDPVSPLIVLAWIGLRQALNLNDTAQLKEAHDCALAMQKWAEEKKGKGSLLAAARRNAVRLIVNFGANTLADALEAKMEELLDGVGGDAGVTVVEGEKT